VHDEHKRAGGNRREAGLDRSALSFHVPHARLAP
jgi:hypothetical protein